MTTTEGQRADDAGKRIKRPTRDLEHEPIKQLDNSEGGKVSGAGNRHHHCRKVQRQPVIAHLIRATERFNDRLGNQFGAAITYFLIFIDDPDFDGVVCRRGLCAGLPSDVATGYLRQNSAKHQRSDASRHVEKHHQHRRSAAYDCRACRLAVALYSGINWMGNLREAIRAQSRDVWERSPQDQEKFWVKYLRDFISLIGLLIALIVTLSDHLGCRFGAANDY